MNPMQKLRTLIARGLVNLINDSGGLQTLQADLLADETKDGIERFQNFGMSSHPPAGSVAACVAVAGVRDNLVAVAVDNEEHRPKDLALGESCYYNAHGIKFLFDKDGKATLDCKEFVVNAETAIHFHTPTADFDQAVLINGLLSFMGGISGEGGGEFSGNFTHGSGSFISNGVTVHLHFHSGVQQGINNTGGPVGAG